MGKFISNITMEQATCRVHFTKLNPTNPDRKEKRDCNIELNNNTDNVDEAFPVSELLKSEGYKSYLLDPLGEDKLDKALELCRFK